MDSLPTELLHDIFDNLDIGDLLVLNFVSRNFYSLGRKRYRNQAKELEDPRIDITCHLKSYRQVIWYRSLFGLIPELSTVWDYQSLVYVIEELKPLISRPMRYRIKDRKFYDQILSNSKYFDKYFVYNDYSLIDFVLCPFRAIKEKWYDLLSQMNIRKFLSENLVSPCSFVNKNLVPPLEWSISQGINICNSSYNYQHFLCFLVGGGESYLEDYFVITDQTYIEPFDNKTVSISVLQRFEKEIKSIPGYTIHEAASESGNKEIISYIESLGCQKFTNYIHYEESIFDKIEKAIQDSNIQTLDSYREMIKSKYYCDCSPSIEVVSWFLENGIPLSVNIQFTDLDRLMFYLKSNIETREYPYDIQCIKYLVKCSIYPNDNQMVNIGCYGGVRSGRYISKIILPMVIYDDVDMFL